MKTHQSPLPNRTLRPSSAFQNSIWYLERGQALSYRANQDERLRVTYGRIWLTKANCSSDYVLDAAQPGASDLLLSAGDSVVIEAWPHGAFEVQALDPQAAAPAGRALQLAQTLLKRLQRALTKPRRHAQPHSACA
jgi:Protein of unknown function (DUF2917)